jgi:hypothetical protein
MRQWEGQGMVLDKPVKPVKPKPKLLPPPKKDQGPEHA